MLYNMLYNILYNIVWMIAWCSAQDGPGGARSFHCQLAYYTRREKKVDAMFIKDLIQKVLHHPDFDPDDVDHDMHERLMAAIEEGDLEDRFEEGW